MSTYPFIQKRDTSRWLTERDRQQRETVKRHAGQNWRIQIFEETRTEDAMSSLYCAIQGFVSLHRSEGFGCGSAEAICHGKLVGVMAYSGARDLYTQETAKLVEYRVATAHLDDCPCLDSGCKPLWAETAIGSAARQCDILLISEYPIERAVPVNGQSRGGVNFGVFSCADSCVSPFADTRKRWTYRGDKLEVCATFFSPADFRARMCAGVSGQLSPPFPGHRPRLQVETAIRSVPAFDPRRVWPSEP